MATDSLVTAAPRTELALPTWLVRIFALDLRALVALRVGLAVLLLTDLAVRARDIVAHYTDDGVLPRSARMAMEWDFCEPWWLSLHMLSGSVWWQVVLFTAAAVAAAMLLIGYKTRPALFVSWLLLYSLHGRFPLLTQGGDALLRCMLFWSLFLPLGRAEGKGQKAKVEAESPTFAFCPLPSHFQYVASFGTAAFIVQLALMYLFTAMLKTGAAWRSDFSAAYYALSIDHFTSELGYVLLGYPRLLQLLTFASILLEWTGPLLLLLPIWHQAVRILVPLSFIGFHLGLAATMDLGTFPWICMLFWVVLLPPCVWDWFQHVGRVACECLGLHRIQFGNSGDGSSDVQIVGSFTLNAMAGFLLAYVVLLNIHRLQHPRAMVGGPPLSLISRLTGLDQYWNMFSPAPYQFGGWLRIEGETADGRLVNLYRPDAPLPDTRPANVSATYPTQYWRRCLVTMYEFQEHPHIEGGLRYFARQWNAAHGEGDRVVRARFVHMVEPVLPPFESTKERNIERKVLGTIEL